jgi:HK97 family phage prohead protease
MADMANTSTPDAADLNTAARKQLASQGIAMPDGSYPIRNRADLEKAIHAVGRGSGSHDAIRAHIIRRAHALGASDMLPSDWTGSDNTSRSGRASVPADVPIEHRLATVSDVDLDRREITLIAIPYNEHTFVEYRGKIIEEVVEPGAFNGIEKTSNHVTANRDHDYKRTVGKAVGYDTADSRGLVATLKVSRTALGDEALELARDGVLKASVGMLVKRSDQTIKNGLRTIHKAFLDHIALVPSPAYAGAEVLAVRERDDFTEVDPDAEYFELARQALEIRESHRTSGR